MPAAIVVGAGVFGASLAHRLTLEGWSVTIVDRCSPGHIRAESGGESRLMRFSHGADRWYTRSARRARELWRELEEEAGVELLVESGLAWFGYREGGWEDDSERTLREEGIPVERLAPSDAAGLFPSLAAHDLAFVLWEPEAGILHARLATRTLVERAVARGARLVGGDARPDGHAVRVNGDRLAADRVVWACGAWLPGIFPDLVSLRVTRQDVLFFGAGHNWATPPVPGWVDYDRAFYGLGDLGGCGVKVCPDVEGPAFDPEAGSRVPPPEGERRAREYLAARFPALAQAPLVGASVCQYSLTPDTHFIAAAHPEHGERVWLLGGGSGHGFKHGPALAEHAARCLGGQEPADPRFGLGPREPGRGLRTAGR